MSFAAVSDLIFFGVLFVVMIPLFLVAFNPFVVISSVLFALYTSTLGFFCLRRIPRWCRSKKGLHKILYWMFTRVTIFMWTFVCYVIIFINICISLSTHSEDSVKTQAYVGIALLLPAGWLLSFQIYSAISLLWTVKTHLSSPKKSRSSRLHTHPPAVVVSAANSNQASRRVLPEHKGETDHVLMGSALQTKAPNGQSSDPFFDDNQSQKSMNTVSSSKRFGLRLGGPKSGSKNKVHPVVGVAPGDTNKPRKPTIPQTNLELKKN